uniref:Uncharacterized protein n=1 Tax=Arundo donax TaxID=35708 RepID=A0A0A9G219_ARUDO
MGSSRSSHPLAECKNNAGETNQEARVPPAMPGAWRRQISASQDPHLDAASPPPCLPRGVLGSSLHSAGSGARWRWMDLLPAAGWAVASS